MLGKEVFARRREKLKNILKEGDAILLVGHPAAIRNNDNHHLFRQESSLYYFTGCKEENTVMLFRPGMTPEYTLFLRPKDAIAELWDGYRHGVEGAKRDLLADEAYEVSMLGKMLLPLLKDSNRLYYQLGLDPKMDSDVLAALERVRAAKGRTGLGILPLYDATEITGEARIIKDEEEIDLMRKSGQIAAEAHKEAMRFTEVGKTEKQIQGVLSFKFLNAGADDYAYHPIVGTGNNATVLHYRDNDKLCKDGDLLLIDAGCEYDFYASDITRTFPVNGKFTAAQTKLYQAVLKAQLETIEIIKPGTLFSEVQEKAIESLSASLKELEILEESVEEIISQKLYRKYYPHNIGHWIGLDVHDRGKYLIQQESRPLEEGMMLTIEPGLYIPEGDMDAPAEYRGMGIRIEDDILVTKDGYENLTKDVPKEIPEIEALMAEKSFLA
ncbi:MAG: Xaa-Pro aminopeptidase [Bdellovibrionaceae bacterium]|nr:Xaa-Pro aminopeptidase [Pseudobdellovibrionaceae bacterium]|tara:strand:+ start:76525 stop:77847 length:1323 start_codon:yes stop_codon:yes gene_type:complete